ncbi:MAG TPA: SPASM domain-containing protein [Candidatus Limnocylindrales bacterium]|nr:SPASM domain-containing protein [Candidatus Limnocylindrales bacterium]
MEIPRPMRVRWDVDFRGRTGRTKRIARQIRETSPELVELRIEGETGLSELPAIFTEIHKCNPRVVSTVRLFPGAASAAQRGYSMDFIWEVDARGPFRGLLPHGAESISVTIDEDSLAHCPDVLEEFAASVVRELHLPNVNSIRSLAEVGHVPLPQPGKLRDAAEIASRLPVSLEGKRLVVHDYILWKHLRAVFPGEAGERIEFSECRAASAHVYVDWEGNVYPCESLPIRLGNLQERTFEKIWRSPARLQILETVRAVPDACGPCDQAPGCLSVCRGLLRDVPGSPDAAQMPRMERPATGRS